VVNVGCAASDELLDLVEDFEQTVRLRTFP
jgi:hypothetical protein